MNLNKIPPQITVYGDQAWRGKCPLEVAEQVSFLCLLRAEFPKLAEIAVHIRNEGERTKRQGAAQKAEGLNTGASDLLIPCTPSILIELKRRDHTQSSITDKQIKYLVNSEAMGSFACVALGAIGAMEAVRSWHTINHQK